MQDFNKWVAFNLNIPYLRNQINNMFKMLKFMRNDIFKGYGSKL